MFPKIIYMCNKTIGEYEKNKSKLWKKLNPDYEIKLYDNKMCKDFLMDNYGKKYREIFEYIPDGPIKADFWRVCILHKLGGVYSDVDNVPLLPLNDFIEKDVDFVTCTSYWDEMKFNYNPNLIICNKDNAILEKCIDWYIQKYKGKVKYEYWDYSIMNAFTQILHPENFKKEYGIYNLDNMRIQLIKECPGRHHYDAHNIYNDKRVFNNRDKNWNFETHTLM
jgi:hypothetical protein